ncbi:MAG: nucleotide-binding protein [Desulfurococcaceae archaeon]
MSHVDTSSSRRVAVVLDTGALLAKYYRLIPRLDIDTYTTPSAVCEVKDHENRTALAEAIDLGLVKAVAPRQPYVSTVMQAAVKIGSVHKLSITDLDVAALAVQLQSSYPEVVVITDDYELENLLAHLGVSFKPLRTHGIRELRRFIAMCPTCGYVPGKPGEETCPLCGTEISRRRST